MSEPVLLIGVGFMGRAYAEVLRDVGRPVIVIGRSLAGVSAFEEATGLQAETGGLSAWLERGVEIPRSAIVCVTTSEAAGVSKALLAAGVKRILIEKPGGVTPEDISDLALFAEARGAEVLIGYNRRFYASVLETERRIAAEGGVTSFHFEFTERERDATSGKFSHSVQQHWVLANSSHVIDLAFFLGGEPKRLSAEITGAGLLDWHPSGAQFVGSGISDSGALFSYCANWTSGGRWGVEIMTRESRLILRPLEQLYVQRRGTFAVEPVAIQDKIEACFKPGLHRQTIAFLNRAEEHRFISVADQARRAAGIYAAMSGEKRATVA